MSVIPLKADIHQRGLYVRLVPEAEVAQAELPMLGGESSRPNQLTSGVPQHGRGRSVALPCGLIRRRS
jgi:hypothetical protein